MTPTQERERLRAILAGPDCITPASVWDPISAKVAESVGFEVGMLAGSVASATTLAAPDLIVLTLTEFADQIRRIKRASSLSLMLDADHGYGNALNVYRTIEECEHAGASGLSIEDTYLPTGFGRGDGETLISIEEGVGKMRAALEARRDGDLVIAGRTSAIGITGLADTIARVKAYAATGVDAIFLVGVTTRSDLEAIAAEVSLPIILGGGGTKLADRAYLAAQGVRIALQGHQPFQASVRAIHDTLKALRDGVAPADLGGLASGEMMARATRSSDSERWTRAFLGT